MKVLTIFKRKKGRRSKQKTKSSEGVTDEEETQPSSSVSPEPGEDEEEEEDDERQPDYFSDSSRASPSPTPSSIPNDTPRDSSPSPSPSPNPRPPSPTPSTSRSLSPSPSPSPSPERVVPASQKATLALLASLAAGVARERRVSFEIPPRNVTPDLYSNSNYRSSSPSLHSPAVPATPPPSALRNPLLGSSPSPSPSYPPLPTSPIPSELHPYPQSASLYSTPPSQPEHPSPSPTHHNYPHYPTYSPYMHDNASDSESGDGQNEMISETSSPSPGISDAEPEGEDEEVFEEDELVDEMDENGQTEEDREARREAEAIYRAIRAKRRKGRPLTNMERRVQVIEAREKWLSEQEILLKGESERLADLNLNLNLEKQSVDRQKRAAQRAEVSARTRVRRAEDILHMKERAIDIVKEGLQDDKRVIQMKRDILMLQKSQIRTGRRSTPYKFPKLLPSRRANGLVTDDLSFTGSGISSLPWKRRPPSSLIATYAPAASIPRGSGPIPTSASPPPRPMSKSSSSPVRRTGAQTPNGTPVVTIDLSSFADTTPTRTPSRHSATPPFYRKHRASYPASPYPNMYLYEHEGEDDFLDVEEPPMSFRLQMDESNHSNYEHHHEEDPALNGELEENLAQGEEAMEEGVPPAEEVMMEEHQVEEDPPAPIPVTAPELKIKRSTSASRKKQSNLLQQLQVHMSPQQQQRFNMASTPPQTNQSRIPTTPPNTSPTDAQVTPSPTSPAAPTTPSTPTTPSGSTRKVSPGRRLELEESPKKRVDKPPDRKPPPPPHATLHNDAIPAITVSPSPIPGSPSRLQNTPSAGNIGKPQPQPQSQPQPSQPPYQQQPPFQPNPFHQPPFPPQPFPHQHPFQPNPFHHQGPQPQFQQPPFHPYPPGFNPPMYQPQHQQVPPQQQQHPFQPPFHQQFQQQQQMPPHHFQPPQPQPQPQSQPQSLRSFSPPKQQPVAANIPPSNGPLKTKQNSNNNITSSVPSTPPAGIPQPSPKVPNPSPMPTNSPSNSRRTISPQKQTPAPPVSPTPPPITAAHFSSIPSSPSSPKKHLALHAQELQSPAPPPAQMLPESSLLCEPLTTDSENISVISLTNDKWKAGFLMRREGSRMAVNWPRKYIVMTKTGLLYYFRSAVDFTTSGYTDLNNYSHIKIPQDPKNRHNYPKFTFQLVSKAKRSSSPSSSSPSPPTSPTPILLSPKVLLSADSRKEMNAWIHAINMFWQNEEEKKTVKKQTVPTSSSLATSSSSNSSSSPSVVSSTPTPIPTVVRTPSPPVKVNPPLPPPAEVKQKNESEAAADHYHKKRASRGKKIVS